MSTDKSSSTTASNECLCPLPDRWYVLDATGLATLCAGQDDAQDVSAECFLAWPQRGPYRAVLLGDVAQARAEIKRLLDVLTRLQQWADAYPLTVFPEPDFTKAHELLTAGGMTLDAISASNMRYVLDGARQMLAEGLGA